MLRIDRDALVCDMAETYHVYDFRAIPVETLATLAAGLRDDSRIKMRVGGIEYVPPIILLARIADSLALIQYGLMHDDDTPLPRMVMDILAGGKRVEQSQSEAQKATFALIEAEVKQRMEVG